MRLAWGINKQGNEKQNQGFLYVEYVELAFDDRLHLRERVIPKINMTSVL